MVEIRGDISNDDSEEEVPRKRTSRDSSTAHEDGDGVVESQQKADLIPPAVAELRQEMMSGLAELRDLLMRKNDDPPPAYDPPPTSTAPPTAVAASSQSIGTNTTSVSSSGEDSFMRMHCIQNQAIRLERLQSQERQMQLYENMILQNTSRGRANL